MQLAFMLRSMYNITRSPFWLMYVCALCAIRVDAPNGTAMVLTSKRFDHAALQLTVPQHLAVAGEM